MPEFKIMKEEGKLISGKPEYVKFSVFEKIESAHSFKRNILLITAHGGYTPSPKLGGSLHSQNPQNNGSLFTRFVNHIRYPTKQLSQHIKPSYDAVNQNMNNRISRIKRSKYTFYPHCATAFFVQHDEKLASKRDSTLRRIIQARAIAKELYPPNREIIDYNLSDVSDMKQKFGGIEMKRRDFIKAILMEAILLRKDPLVLETLYAMHSTWKDKVLIAVPDILMVTNSTSLKSILNDERNKHYTNVFCSFCRGSSSPESSHSVGHDFEDENTKIESFIRNRLGIAKLNQIENEVNLSMQKYLNRP